MSRETILAEIRRLEDQKIREPGHAAYINAEITALCDKLKQASVHVPRKVV